MFRPKRDANLRPPGLPAKSSFMQEVSPLRHRNNACVSDSSQTMWLAFMSMCTMDSRITNNVQGSFYIQSYYNACNVFYFLKKEGRIIILEQTFDKTV